MSTVLVTGASGLIGKESIAPLKALGYDVVPLTSKNFNLLDLNAVNSVLRSYEAEYLLHFAWVTGGDYLTNPINNSLLVNSFEMLKLFYEFGGKRAVFAGSLLEYDLSNVQNLKLYESFKLKPQTLYANAKNELNKLCCAYSKRVGDLSFAWGRIFNVYGRNEKEGRLTNYIITNLINNNFVTIKYGQLIRDYIYSKDVALAFINLMESNVTGNVNICIGKGISLGNFAKLIATKLGKLNLLNIDNEATNQPLSIIGDNGRLVNEVGFTYQTDIDCALNEIIDSYIRL